jgi:vacuolar protein sorting-associated protein 26
MSSFFFSTPVDIDIVLEDTDDRQTVDVKLDKNRREKAPLYMDGESVKGAVTIRPKDGRRLEHTGIKVQFIGLIGTRSLNPNPSKPPSYVWLEMFFDRGNHYEFLSLGSELAAPGELQHPQTFPFNFKNVEKQYESYNGINVKLRYFVRVTVSRRMADVIREKDIWVYSYRIPPEINSSIKMDVGIEDCLHIEFEYSKSKYHLKDVIVGRIYFLLVRLKIKHMELSIIRRETTGAAPNQYNESETLVRFEVTTPSTSFPCPSYRPSLCLVPATLSPAPTNTPKDNGWLPLPRRNNPNPPLPRRLRPDSNLPRSQQKVLRALLPLPGPHRRRRTTLLQAI